MSYLQWLNHGFVQCIAISQRESRLSLNYSSCIPVITMVVNVIYVFPLLLGPLSVSDSFAVLVKSPTSFIFH